MGMEKGKDILFPRRCPICDAPAPFGNLICEDCRKKLQYVEEPRCCRCGKALKAEEKEYCYDCEHRKHQFEQGIAVFEYSVVKDAIYKYKYSSRAEYAEFFGREMADALMTKMEDWKPDALIPVPMYAKKEKQRGYNQAKLLARVVSERTKIPVFEDLILRVRKTVPMKELDVHERQINLKNAFIVGRYDVKLERVIVVDDIYTTGSTIDAMAVELKKIGVQKIYFISLAIGLGM